MRTYESASGTTGLRGTSCSTVWPSEYLPGARCVGKTEISNSSWKMEERSWDAGPPSSSCLCP